MHLLKFYANTNLNLPLQVQSHGPADTAGVENNDFLVEVNGENVMNESYDKVVARIQSSGDKLTVLVCSKDAYKYFQDQNIPITASMADPIHDTSEPAAYAETIPAESERTSPEPRERVSNTISPMLRYHLADRKRTFFYLLCIPGLGSLTCVVLFKSVCY